MGGKYKHTCEPPVTECMTPMRLVTEAWRCWCGRLWIVSGMVVGPDAVPESLTWWSRASLMQRLRHRSEPAMPVPPGQRPPKPKRLSLFG